MARVTDILKRIQAVQSTKKITQAVKMVATVKVGQTKRRIGQLKAYQATLRDIFWQCRPELVQVESPYLTPRPTEKVLLLFFATDKGFCGSFNRYLLQEVARRYEHHMAENRQIDIMPIGTKGLMLLKVQSMPYIAHYVGERNTNKLAKLVMENYLNGSCDRVEVIYQSHKVATAEGVVCEPLLPFTPPTATGKRDDLPPKIIYEPSAAEIITDLLPRMIMVALRDKLLRSEMATYTTRMLLMNQATENADTLIKGLNLQYNKMRQAAITRQIAEIAAGAEAFK